ncbi:MAG: nickel-dependent lactate racemase [Acidobacteria bacterium]|nr:nickel-dependent lactate racemase [Acidobacteriota bacterium]MBI3282030.1 nickel-dependent lactate racemase [Acidobacteriota bacterium]
MRVDFAFGSEGLPIELPAGYRYRVLEARSATPLADSAQAIEDALDAPIGTKGLRELAFGKSSAAISVCDITRPAPNRQTLPSLLRRLQEAGVPREGVTILIATGLHRPATAEEIELIVGPEIARNYRVVNHDARQLSEHRLLGNTASGTPVYVDERFVSAGLRLTLGFIEPHLMLGFSGGRKLVAPGLAAQETIKVLHSPKFMRDARAVEGSVEDNPLHRELLEIARMARQDFILDVALARDRRIAGVFAGHAEQAHAEGMRFVSRVMLEQLPGPADAVITSSAGYPLDLTFYQAIKGITAAQHIVKPGGRILLVAECREGAGAAEFRDMLKWTPSCSEFLQRIGGTPVVVDQWQLEKLALVARRAEVLFYTPGLPADYHETLWGKAFGNAEAAVKALFEGLPAGATVALVPEGPYVLAKAEAAEAAEVLV